MNAGARHAEYLATRSFGALDGLRALSIIAVVWHHSGPGFPALPITTRGFLGVDLFFVISGFLIVTLLLRERRQTGAVSLRRFYARRFLRIFPAYYAMLALVAVIVFLRPQNAANPIRDELPFAIFYVSNLVPMHSLLSITWSLSTEEQFYFIVPALEKHAGRAFTLLLALAYVVVTLPAFWLWPALPLPEFFRQTTFGPILLGVLLAHVLDDQSGYSRVVGVLGKWWAPLAALVLVLVTASHPATDISGWPRLAIHWSMAALVASCVVQERHALSAPLRLPPLRRLGVVSYGVYLYHLLVAHFVAGALTRVGRLSKASFFTGTLLATWLVAELSFRLFESRFLVHKRRFAAPEVAQPIAALTTATVAPPSPT